MIHNHLEQDFVSGQLGVLLGPGVQAVNQRHVVVGVGRIPLAAKQRRVVTGHSVGMVLDDGILNLLNQRQCAGCFLGGRIEGDSNVVVAMLCNCLGEVVAIALRPLKSPVVVAHDLVLEGTDGQLNVLARPGVNAVGQCHVIVGVGAGPVQITGYRVSRDLNGGNRAFDFKPGSTVVVIKGEYILSIAIELVGVAGMLGGYPIAIRCYILAIGGGAITELNEITPVAIGSGEAIAEAEVNILVLNGGGIGPCAVSIFNHRSTTVGMPTCKGGVTNNVHSCIGVNANERNHH